MPICTACKEDKPNDQFYWFRTRGRYSWKCKKCENARSSAWKKQKAATCTEWVENLRRIGRERSKVRYQAEKSMLISYFKDRYRNNKERVLLINERWRKANGEKVRAASRKRHRLNPTVAVARLAMRKARKIQARPKWLTPIHKCLIEEMYDVARAKTVQTGMRYEVDHIAPLVSHEICGLHVPWNLRVVPISVNRKKSTRLIHESAVW